MKKHDTRERWLREAVDRLRPLFAEMGEVKVPAKVRVSTGFARGSRGFLGAVYNPEVSTDKTSEIFVSPVLDDPVEIIGTLIHEVAHTIHFDDGHGSTFTRLVRLMGLAGKPTSTYIESGSDIEEIAQALAEDLGPYTHAKMKFSDKDQKKQGTRMLKLQCPACGCIVRTTAKWVEEYTEWPCPCGEFFKLEVKE